MATRTWSGAVNSDMNNTGNYDGAGALAGEDLVFDSGAVAATASAALGVKSITTTAGYSGAFSAAGFVLTADEGMSFQHTGALTWVAGTGKLVCNGVSATLYIGSGVGTLSMGAVEMNGTTGMTLDFEKGGNPTSLVFGAGAKVTNTSAVVNTVVGHASRFDTYLLTMGAGAVLTTNVYLVFTKNNTGAALSIGSGATIAGTGFVQLANASRGSVSFDGLVYTGSNNVRVLPSAAANNSTSINGLNSGARPLVLYDNYGASPTFTLTGTIVCGILSFGNGYSLGTGTGTYNFNGAAFTLTQFCGVVADANNIGPSNVSLGNSTFTGVGNWTWGAQMTVNPGTSTVNFTASGTVKSYGKKFGSVTVATGVTLTLADDLCCAGTFTSSGTATVTATSKQLCVGGAASFSGTLSAAGATLLMKGATCTFAAGMTLTIDASTVLILSAASNTLTTNGVTMPRIVNGAAVFPDAVDVLRVADGGPATWGHNTPGEYGPGTAVAATSNSSTSFSPSSCSDSSRSVASQSNSSDSFSVVVTTGTDSIQAQITKNIKACLKGITVANGYNYDVAMVEESRKLLDISDRWPFILLLENEPEKDDEGLVIRELSYVVWFFSKQDDRVISDPADASKDVDTEIAYYDRNAIADITKALNVDIYRGHVDNTSHARAEITEIIPGTHDLYVDETIVMFGTWCAVRVVTNIDATNPYQLRNGI